MNKPNDLQNLPNAQTITPDGGRDPYFVIGDDRAQAAQGEIVAAAVSVNFTLRDGERTRGHGIALHEVPLMRRLYPSGTVTLHPEWVPGINRSVPMTRRMFEEEIRRLAIAYTIPAREGSGANKIFAEVYGDTEAEATTKLHSGMEKIYNAWKKLETRALAQFKKAGGKLEELPKGAIHGLLHKFISDKDLEAIVAEVEPRAKTLESVKLSSIEIDGDVGNDEPEAAALPGDEVRKPLVAEFMAAGFDASQADELATLTTEAGPELDDVLLLQSSLAVDGKVDAKLAKKARKITSAWAERQKVTT